jgi:photosystem II stability/assembly factor-like uncharacterized protein
MSPTARRATIVNSRLPEDQRNRRLPRWSPDMSARPLRRVALAGLAGFAATAIAACGDDSTLDAGAPQPETQGPALEHIHGLGVSPSDKRLFIATHNGLFSAPEGQTTPKPVGSSRQDVMGFSVVGRSRFIGSGHPSPDQQLPPNLGLIESRDGGRSWKNISLLGEADFHSLESSGDRVYGFDATQGRLMVSADGGRTWAKRTPPAAVFGLAIDPADPQRVVVSTEDGVFMSPNAGRGWRPLRPDLAGLLAWSAPDRMYLVDGEGQVFASADGGREWRTQGSIGAQPAAFIAADDALYAALADGAVKRSTDGGGTWAARTLAP